MYRVCRSGIVSTVQKGFQIIQNCFPGPEIEAWLQKTGVLDSKNLARACTKMLVRLGMVDIVWLLPYRELSPTSNTNKTLLPRNTASAISNNSIRIERHINTESTLYSFRASSQVPGKETQHYHGRFGYMWKVSRWRSYQRFFVWDRRIQRLSYYMNSREAERAIRSLMTEEKSENNTLSLFETDNDKPTFYDRIVDPHDMPRRQYWLNVDCTIKALEHASDTTFNCHFQITFNSKQNGEECLLLAASERCANITLRPSCFHTNVPSVSLVLQ